MSDLTATAPPPTEEANASNDAALEYRSIHTMAVLGLLIGAVSAVTLTTAGTSFEWTLAMAPIPLIGLLVSMGALRSIASAPDVYTGEKLARGGVVLSALFLATSIGYGGFVYATEVPDGYERISFLDTKPSEKDLVDRKLIPDEVRTLIEDGDKIFIKGYIRPDSIKFKQNLKSFLLVRDNQQCCFGDLSKVQFYDQIQIDLGTGLTTDFTRGLFRLGGVLKVGPGDPNVGTPLTYRLDADYVDP